MEVSQIYSLVNSVNKQLWGEDALTVNDLKGLIALGDTVFSSNTNRDMFLNKLVDRIGKTIIRNLDLEVEFPNFMRNEMEFGCILQKINIQLTDAVENKSWTIADDNFTPNQFKIDKPVIRQSLFSKFVTWEYDLTVPDKLYRSAFTDASTMGAFIEGIMNAQGDSLTLALNNLMHVALCNFIAEKAKAENGMINVYALYMEAYPNSTLTASQALTAPTPEFLKFVGMIMRNYIGYLAQPSKLYNTEGMLRATARDNLHVLISTDWFSAYETMLTSDTFNKEIISLPLFERYTTLQATSTTAPNIVSNTKVKVKPSSSGENDDEVTVNGVIGIFMDRQAIGTTYRDIYTGTDRNNRNRYTNYTTTADLGLFNDLSESSVIFYIDVVE